MRVVLQRVTEASVTIDGQLFNEIQQGYLYWWGSLTEDNVDTAGKMAVRKSMICGFSRMKMVK